MLPNGFPLILFAGYSGREYMYCSKLLFLQVKTNPKPSLRLAQVSNAEYVSLANELVIILPFGTQISPSMTFSTITREQKWIRNVFGKQSRFKRFFSGNIIYDIQLISCTGKWRRNSILGAYIIKGLLSVQYRIKAPRQKRRTRTYRQYMISSFDSHISSSRYIILLYMIDIQLRIRKWTNRLLSVISSYIAFIYYASVRSMFLNLA